MAVERIQFGGRRVAGFGLGGETAGFGIGDKTDWWYTRIVYPSDVREAKRRVDAKFQSVNNDVVACSGLTEDEKGAWYSLFTTWRRFFCGSGTTTCTEPEAPFLLGAGGAMDDVEQYEKQAYGWQKKIKASKCAVGEPAEIQEPDVVKREKKKEEPTTWPYWLGAAAAAAVGIYVVAPIVKEVIATRQASRRLAPAPEPTPEPTT
jgi:hypothetical protein